MVVTETATATATATVTEVATATVTETVVAPAEPVCGSDDLPPCAVAFDDGGDPWLKVALATLVLIGATTLVTLWGKR